MTDTKTTDEVRNELIAEWEAYCKAQGIPHTSIDEVDTESLTREQSGAVLDFERRWNANEERALDERTEARDNEINEARALSAGILPTKEEANALHAYHFTLPPVIAKMKAEVLQLVAEGRIPVTVQSFGDLHDHIDANELGGFCDDGYNAALVEHFGGRDRDEGWPDGMLNFINDAQAAVHEWIVAGGLLADRVLGLLAELRAAYPSLYFEPITKASQSIDDETVPAVMIAVLAADTSIIDPHSSECGRFPVDCEAAYGIPKGCAAAVVLHNNYTA